MTDPTAGTEAAPPDQRPPPDPVKLAGQFAEWTRGEPLVGRMLANLKTGGLPEVLAPAVDGPRAEAAAALTAHWEGWEQGTTVPLEVAEGYATLVSQRFWPIYRGVTPIGTLTSGAAPRRSLGPTAGASGTSTVGFGGRPSLPWITWCRFSTAGAGRYPGTSPR
ncbi:MAG: hypothetical protein CM1200mP26_04750 [Acidimicrobiales bacterium]|nr:MAG: hypothetical protein CM1200mP26_04750 [Acidimicrobiales bacterium]